MTTVSPNDHRLCEYFLQCCSNKNERIFLINMVNKCCLPKCNSNNESSVLREGLKRCFSFPKDEILQAAWLRKILRANLTISKNTVGLHQTLKERNVIKEHVVSGKDGNADVIIPRKHVKLKHIVIPCVFSNLPFYFSELTSAAEPRQSPSKRRKKIEERQEAMQQN